MSFRGGGGAEFWQVASGILKPLTNPADFEIHTLSGYIGVQAATFIDLIADGSAADGFININSNNSDVNLGGGRDFNVVLGNDVNILADNDINLATQSGGTGDINIDAYGVVQIGIAAARPAASVYLGRLNNQQFDELGADPAAPAANQGLLYSKDDGDGATKLFLRNTTDVQELATINASGNIQPTAQDTAATAGKARGVVGGTGNTTGAGGAVAIAGGVGGNDAVGGKASVTGGAAGGGNRAGGVAELKSGAGSGTAAGGVVNLIGGVGGLTSGTGGRVAIGGGVGGGPNGSGGNVIAAPGLATGAGTNGKMQLFDADFTNVLIEIGSTLNTLGFFGAAPTAKPTGVAVDAAGIHAALVTLGLIAA